MDNIWITKYLLSGNPDRLRVATNQYLINYGTREEPRFGIAGQGEFMHV